MVHHFFVSTAASRYAQMCVCPLSLFFALSPFAIVNFDCTPQQLLSSPPPHSLHSIQSAMAPQ